MSPIAETSNGRRSRRRFTDEFTQQTVRLVFDEAKSVTAVARELEEERDILKNYRVPREALTKVVEILRVDGRVGRRRTAKCRGLVRLVTDLTRRRPIRQT